MWGPLVGPATRAGQYHHNGGVLVLDMLVLKRVLPYVVSIILILGVCFWIYQNGYSSGSQDTVREYEQRIQEERERLIAANQAAQESARSKEAELQKLLGERDETIRLLLQDAISDPDAGNSSLSVDSVRRIDRIH